MVFTIASLLYLIPPVILIGFITYYVKILGRIISDFEPYVDDRKYAEDFFGFTFFLGQILYPFFWAFLTYFFVSKYLGLTSFTWLPLIITFFIGTYYQVKYFGLSAKFFYSKEKIEQIQRGINLIASVNKQVANLFASWIIGEKKKNFFFIYVLFTFAIFNYYSNNIFIMLINYFTIFVMLLIITCIYAMSTRKLLDANIFFDQKENIKNCKIIKIGEDMIRIKHKDEIFLINKSRVKFIELTKNKIISEKVKKEIKNQTRRFS